MRNIKVILLSFLILFGIVQLYALFIPSKVIISRATNIAVPKDKLLPLINNFNSWKSWNNALVLNKDFVIAADGQSVKAPYAQYQFLNKTDTSINYAITQNKSQYNSTINLLSVDSITTVQWQYQINYKWYPWEKFKAIFADNIYGTVLDSALISLKAFAEKK